MFVYTRPHVGAKLYVYIGREIERMRAQPACAEKCWKHFHALFYIHIHVFTIFSAFTNLYKTERERESQECSKASEELQFRIAQPSAVCVVLKPATSSVVSPRQCATSSHSCAFAVTVVPGISPHTHLRTREICVCSVCVWVCVKIVTKPICVRVLCMIWTFTEYYVV